MNATERMPGDAEAIAAIAEMRSQNWWSVGDLLTYRPHGCGPSTQARVLQVFANGRLLVRHENNEHTAIIDPSCIVRV
jgi:hypothetical protein